jgi:hypothetical protein
MLTFENFLQDVLRRHFLPVYPEGERILVVGGEVGGGIMAGQCAALTAVTHPEVNRRCELASLRKK